MTIERAKELLPIIKAYIEGKDIQIQSYNGVLGETWWDVDELVELKDNNKYRIKPDRLPIMSGNFKIHTIMDCIQHFKECHSKITGNIALDELSNLCDYIKKLEKFN